MKEKSIDENVKKKLLKKRIYKRPTIISGALTIFGAACNGTTTGGRKSASGPPDFCNSSRLLS